MKIFLLSFILCLPAFATRSVTIKGTLLSYTEKDFKIKEGKRVWQLPLTVMSGPDQVIIEKKLGKEIEVSAPVNLVKKSK